MLASLPSACDFSAPRRCSLQLLPGISILAIKAALASLEMQTIQHLGFVAARLAASFRRGSLPASKPQLAEWDAGRPSARGSEATVLHFIRGYGFQ
jgi:hypothetical protein